MNFFRESRIRRMLKKTPLNTITVEPTFEDISYFSEENTMGSTSNFYITAPLQSRARYSNPCAFNEISKYTGGF